MSWSYRVARISGIDIKIHLTFLLIVFFFALQWGTQHGSLAGALFGAVLVIALFACVTLHELGHSLAAQYFGIPVREIILLPLGGVALLGRNPTKPIHELVIALAGPLVNVAIAIGLLVVIATGYNLEMISTSAMLQGTNVDLSLATLLIWLLEANILLVLFNMIPAFPLDGGRVLRAVLAMFMGFRRATRIASFTGQVFAVFLGILGLISFDVILILIAVFIYLGAGQENAEGQASTVLSTQRVGDAYNKHVLTLSIGDRVRKVLDYVLTSYQPDFAVVQGTRLLGIVTRDDVLRALAADNVDAYIPDIYVTALMRREFLKVEADASLDEVRQLMSEQGERVVAVYDGDMYLGLVNIDDIAEAFTVLSFTDRYNQTRRPPGSSSVPRPEETTA